MDARRCSILVVTDAEHSDDSFSLLHTVFSYVTFVPTDPDIVGVLQSCIHNKENKPSTLVLLDDQAYTKRSLFDTLESIQFATHAGLLEHAAPIVYSPSNSSEYMMECLDHGAIDYIVKPLRPEVVNTLFLNVIRSSTQQHQHLQKQSSAFATARSSVDANAAEGEMWKAFKQRLLSVFEINHNLIHQHVSEFFTSSDDQDRSRLKCISSERNSELKTRLSSWSFAPFDLDRYELIQCVFLVLQHVLALPDLHHISISEDDLYDFIFDVATMYQSLNPYHNFRHAVDVMQATYYFVCRAGLVSLMDPCAAMEIGPDTPHGRYSWLKNSASLNHLLFPFDILALILASIGHDVGHPGVNNVFMIRTATPLALIYNDRSVLESFHAMVFFNILQRHCFQPLTEWQTIPEYTRFRKIVVHSILATDMGLHDDYVNKIQGQWERFNTNQVDTKDQAQADDEIILICGSIIKCADISNCARPFPVAERWAQVLQREFHEQGDLEKELGLSVLPINDRGKISLEDFQLGFKKNVAAKLFEVVTNVLPDLGFAVKNIYDNCSIWEERKQKPHDSGVGTEATSSAVSSDFDVTDVGDQTAHGVEPLEETSSHDEAAIQRDPSNLQRGIPLHRRQSILVEVPSQDHDKESPSNELRGRRLLVKSPCHCILQ